MTWDQQKSRWHCEINGGERSLSTWAVVLCTGFASKKYIPPYKGIESFKGTTIHTSAWPQQGFNLDNKRVALIGTGASGVQAIQEVAHKASKLTVYVALIAVHMASSGLIGLVSNERQIQLSLWTTRTRQRQRTRPCGQALRILQRKCKRRKRYCAMLSD
jgi:cation diffusion facilitator CzcD-associated flavoprotein CzcO